MKQSFKQFIQESDETLSKKDITKLIAEWEAGQEKLAVLSALTSQIESRCKEIGSIMLPIVKSTESQSLTVKSTISKFSQKNGTSVKYKEAFEKALSLVNEEQQVFLKSFLKTVTTKSVTESLKMTCPKVERMVEKVANAKNNPESMKKLVIEIMDLEPESVEEGVMDVINGLLSKAIAFVKSSISTLKEKLSGYSSAVKQLEACL